MKTPGMTLVELLVAMSLLSIVSMICYGTMHTAFFLWENQTTIYSTLGEGQLTVARMAADLRCAYARRALQESVPKVPGLARVYLLGTPKLLDGKAADAVHFVRMTVYGPAEVGYFLPEAKLPGKLVRRYNPAAAGDVTSGEFGDKEVSDVLLENVSQLRIRYLAENGQWNNSWPVPSTTPSSLPKAVGITLALWMSEAGKEFVLPEVMLEIPLGGKDYTTAP